MSRNHSPPALQNVGALSLRIQSQHDTGLLFSVYSQLPVWHMGKADSSLPRTSHNTARPHSASGSHQPASCRSGYRAEYRVLLHPVHTYNEHHSLRQAQCPYPGSFGQAVDSPSAVPGSHDPEVPGKNCLFRNRLRISMQLFLLPHTVPAQDTAAPHLPDRHLKL